MGSLVLYERTVRMSSQWDGCKPLPQGPRYEGGDWPGVTRQRGCVRRGVIRLGEDRATEEVIGRE